MKGIVLLTISTMMARGSLVDLRTDLCNTLNDVGCHPSLRECITPPDAALTSASHLAAEMSQLFRQMDRRVVGELYGEFPYDTATCRCLVDISMVLLRHRELAVSQLQFARDTVPNLHTIWRLAFGDLFNDIFGIYAYHYQLSSTVWGRTVVSALQLARTFHNRYVLSPQFVRRLLTSTDAGNRIGGALNLHLAMYLGLHVVGATNESTEAFCATLAHVKELVKALMFDHNTRPNSVSASAVYDTVISVCPNALSVIDRHRSLLGLIDDPTTRNQRITELFLLMDNLGDLGVVNYEVLWDQTLRAGTCEAYKSALISKVHQTLLTLSYESDDLKSANRIAVIATSITCKDWINVPPELSAVPAELAHLWQTPMDLDADESIVNAKAVIYAALYPLIFGASVEFCANATQLKELFPARATNVHAFSMYWMRCRDELIMKWCDGFDTQGSVI